MTKITKGWPPERRKAQAERLRQTRPWTNATGPKTQAGKQRSRLNAMTHGMDSAAAQELRDALREHGRMLTAMSVIPGLTGDPGDPIPYMVIPPDPGSSPG